MSTLSSKDFSVVIQGPIMGTPNDLDENQLTQQCIASVRHHLPECEIIISTWKGQEVEHLSYDKLVFNDDPGAIAYNDTSNATKFNNNNRQIVSTISGIKIAERKYVIKLRGDCKLVNTNFYKYLENFDSHNHYHLLERRIITSTVFTKDPRKIPFLYHISDVFQIGLRTDMANLWDVPLQEEPATTRYVPLNKKLWNDPYPTENYRMRYASEQYIWYAFCKKNKIDLSLNYFCELPFKKILLSELLVIDNFIIQEPKKIGLELPKKMQQFENYPFLYTGEEWEELYHSYCVKKSLFLPQLKLIFLTYYSSLRLVKKNLKRKHK